jgi:hypothetical protein
MSAMHDCAVGRHSTELGTYCLKRLPSTCTVIIVEHSLIVFDKQGCLENEAPSKLSSPLHFLHNYLIKICLRSLFSVAVNFIMIHVLHIHNDELFLCLQSQSVAAQ